ncbi:putative HAD superfamily hydrolase-like, type 3 [Vibrio nigripulchritudo POn4]|uniref:Cof-type HAD-IIB family hydrolase n=1 Tax=Vibrio nigripulchritudo TaxID=28173 RepID=UPI0003B210B5|nr:Cof-type HAD-IIB family hydrolase [Vibrio nigripulchritudo]CCN66325.1 putative HAD superfamily hydrolase-like, type 3 [Vibrio nigripulchritudo POn4]
MIVNGNTIKAMVTDLDGTLLDPEGNITEYTSCILTRLYVSGIEIVLATGRHPRDVVNLVKPLDFAPTIIGCNGALETQANELIYAQNITFPPYTYRQLMRFLAGPSTHVSVFDVNGWHVSEVNDMVSSYSSKSRFPYFLHQYNHLLTLRANKLLVWSANDIHKIESHLKTLFENECEVAMASDNTIEISPKYVTKATAAERHLSLKGIDLNKETIAFGDGMNDEHILKTAAMGVVMQNAMPELPRRLPNPLFTHSNANDGVAKFLIKFFNLSLNGSYA